MSYPPSRAPSVSRPSPRVGMRSRWGSWPCALTASSIRPKGGCRGRAWRQRGRVGALDDGCREVVDPAAASSCVVAPRDEHPPRCLRCHPGSVTPPAAASLQELRPSHPCRTGSSPWAAAGAAALLRRRLIRPGGPTGQSRHQGRAESHRTPCAPVKPTRRCSSCGANYAKKKLPLIDHLAAHRHRGRPPVPAVGQALPRQPPLRPDRRGRQGTGATTPSTGASRPSR